MLGLPESSGYHTWVKTWSQIFEDNKARLQFFQEKLEHQVDQGAALKHLQERYSEYLEAVITETVSDREEIEGDEETDIGNASL